MIIDQDILKIKNTIKSLLKSKGFKQADLAKYLNLSIPMVRKILNSEKLTIDRLKLICNFLNIDLFEFFMIANKSQTKINFLNEKQFSFISKSNKHLAIFICLLSCRGLDELMLKTEVPFKELSHILFQMDKINIIEIQQDMTYRLLIKTPLQLTKEQSYLFKDKNINWHFTVLKNTIEKLSSQTEDSPDLLRLEVFCHSKTINEIRESLKEIKKNALLNASKDQLNLNRNELDYYSVSIASGKFSGWLEMYKKNR